MKDHEDRPNCTLFGGHKLKLVLFGTNQDGQVLYIEPGSPCGNGYHSSPKVDLTRTG